MFTRYTGFFITFCEIGVYGYIIIGIEAAREWGNLYLWLLVMSPFYNLNLSPCEIAFRFL